MIMKSMDRKVESRGFVGMVKKNFWGRKKREKGGEREEVEALHPVEEESGDSVSADAEKEHGEHPMKEKKTKGRRGRKAKTEDGTDKP